MRKLYHGNILVLDTTFDTIFGLIVITIRTGRKNTTAAT